MSDGASIKLSLVFSVLTALAAGAGGCTAKASPGEDTGTTGTSTSEALAESGTLTFDSDFHVETTGTLQKGKTVRIAYDASRLTACRGDFDGQPGWSITGFWKIGDGPVQTFEAGGFSPSGGTQPPVLSLDQSGDLQIWFQNTSRWGCSAYDSNLGSNYHFAVAPAGGDPGWMGNVQSITSRATCSNGPCDSDFQNVTGPIVYDTWVRQRAAIREIFFQVWKQGVTDFDNADLWKELDVEIHTRVGGVGAFKTAYVSFDRRLGNNARYGFDLGGLDPIVGLTTITNEADCPSFPLTVDPTGQYVQANVDVYFTVNGVELRPAAGATYEIAYSNYKGLFAPCVP